MPTREGIMEGIQDLIDKYGYSLKPEDLMVWLDSQGVAIVRYPSRGEDLTGFEIVEVMPLIGEEQ